MLSLSTGLRADDFTAAAGHERTGQWQPQTVGFDPLVVDLPRRHQPHETGNVLTGRLRPGKKVDAAAAVSLTPVARPPRQVFPIDEQRWDDAFAGFNRWLPDQGELGLYRRIGRRLAVSAYKAGNYAQASAVFALLINNLPDDSDAAFGLVGIGWCHLRQQEWRAAVDVLQRLAERFPDHTHRHNGLRAQAYGLEELGDLSAATAIYQQLIRDDPDDVNRWRADLGAARLLHRQGANTDAIRTLQRGLEVASDTSVRERMQYMIGRLQQQLGQTDVARRTYRELYLRGMTCPYWSRATYRLAVDCFRCRDLDGAQAYLDELLYATTCSASVTPDIGPYVIYLQARVAAARGEWLSVLQAVDDLLAVDTEASLHAGARVLSVEALYRLHDFENMGYRLDALRSSQLVLKPVWRRWMQLRQAQVLAHREEWQFALDLVQPITQDGDADRCWLQACVLAGRCQERLGHHQAARDLWSRILTECQPLDPSSANDVYWRIGTSYFRQRQYSLALAAYLRIRPVDQSRLYGAAALRVGQCLDELGRDAEALQVLRALAGSRADTPDRARARALVNTWVNRVPHESQARWPVSTTQSSRDRAHAVQKGIE